MIEKAIYAILAADSDVTDLVGTRIEPLISAQGGALPRITYYRVSTIRNRHTAGTSGLVNSRVQVDMYAETYLGAQALAKEVREALDCYTGTSGGIVVDSITNMGENDVMEPVEPGEDKPEFRISQDYSCWFYETAESYT